MGSKFSKELDKLNKKELQKFLDAWNKIQCKDWDGLDIIPLSGQSRCYRLRIGRMRLQFKQLQDGGYIPVSYTKRNERTYKK